ncbi:THC0290_0291 family protein [Salinimicrobium sp. WS361]|uniref:THC0290_0291 family protein n=1 Tax=Salinimicrobium sp. WS361 TaxID=3425123 RepID=UPI003D6F7D6F
MTNILKSLMLGFFLFFFGKGTATAQVGMVGQEIGIVAGPVAYFTDYGLRWNLETNSSNVGLGIGLVYYLNFAYRADCNCYARYSYFNDHFRVRAEIDYHQGELNHYGPLAQKASTGGKQLRSMIGEVKVYEMGAHLEYYPLSIRDYTAFAYPIAPYVSLGFNFVGYDPNTYSTLGPLDENIFPTFKGYVSQEEGSTWGVTVGAGFRYRLAVSSDLVMNMQWRYYDTDWLDGLDHDNPQNKFNDMMFWLNFGYIYYLNF